MLAWFWRLLTLLPSWFSSNGKCANFGGVHPKALYTKQKKILYLSLYTKRYITTTHRYNCRCFGVDICHSTPRNTCVIFIRWSSTTFAKWYVGYPSDLIITGSPPSASLLSCSYRPSTKSLNSITSFSVLKRMQNPSWFANFSAICTGVNNRHLLS